MDFPPYSIGWGVQRPTTRRREARFCQAGFAHWRTTIRQHVPHVSTPQATVLTLWSCGMVRARSCALTAVSHWLAQGRQRQEQPVRQLRRAWYDAVPRKRGPKRPAVPVEPCFPVLLGGVVSGGQGTQLALAIDATALGERLVGLAVSGVSRGWARLVAWVVLPAKTNQAWRRAWLRRRRRLRPAMPRHWQGSGLAERGGYAPWWFRRSVQRGWPPFLRINTGGTLRPAGTRCWRPLQRFVPQPG